MSPLYIYSSSVQIEVGIDYSLQSSTQSGNIIDLIWVNCWEFGQCLLGYEKKGKCKANCSEQIVVQSSLVTFHPKSALPHFFRSELR